MTAEMTVQSTQKEELAGQRVFARPEDRRRSQRVMIRVPVVIHAEMNGKPMEMAAHTAGINVHGAMLCAAQNFPAEAKLEVEHTLTHQRVAARVTRQPQASPDGYLIPVEFDTPPADFWHISFPSSDWKLLDS